MCGKNEIASDCRLWRQRFGTPGINQLNGLSWKPPSNQPNQSTTKPANHCQPSNSDGEQGSRGSAVGGWVMTSARVCRKEQQAYEQNQHVNFLFFHEFFETPVANVSAVHLRPKF